MTSVNVHCPRRQSDPIYRHGQNPKALIGLTVVTATACFCSPIPMKPGNTGSGMHTTPKLAAFWLIRSDHERMTPFVNYWLSSHRFISA
jgi:hypothetical protein